MAAMTTIPGAIALLLFFVFTYLHSQSRVAYFRAWQVGWAAYSLHYMLDTWLLLHPPSAPIFFLSQLALVGMAICIFVSTRLTRKDFRWTWQDAAVAVTGLS